MAQGRKETANRTMTVEDLWALERLGTPSLSPDGAQVVVASTRYSMETNKSTSTLWLLSTLGGEPRALTYGGDKDGSPRWSPQGDLIAFTAKREQQGVKDEEAQLYVMAPDGGEARRASQVATGVDAFKWCPDGRHVVLVTWAYDDANGDKAQAARHKAHKERKETGYATSEAQYRYWDHNLPAGRSAQLHLLDVKTSRLRNLFAGKKLELSRAEPDAQTFDVSPDGKRVVFAFDPAAEKRIDGRFALGEIDIRTGAMTVLVQDAGWDCGAPRYSADGQRVAFIASHLAAKHTMPGQLAVWDRKLGAWEVLSAQWDHEVQAPLAWEDDGTAVLFAAEQEGRKHLWRFDLAARRAEVQARGGTVLGFDKTAGTLVALADAIDHPGRLHVHAAGAQPRRIETFNDSVLSRLRLGRSEEVWFEGAAADGKTADRVQMWLTYPPGMDPKGERGVNGGKSGKGGKAKVPLLHLIHGGPHTAFGDAWHYRWNVQLMAAQGYVVACVNYHGSSSFGYAFLDSITHRWGALELADVEAATDLLLKKPWADKRRVFATGGSYGGYMVAWMNGHVKPGRYAAYVCHAGCFDWTAMFADDAYTWHAKELGAWYWDNPALVHAQSPLSRVATMSTPTLVIHGALDYRVPDAQGLAYYNTLKARGVDARLLWYPDENHWILKPRNSRQWYGEFFGWLQRHDPGAQPQRGT